MVTQNDFCKAVWGNWWKHLETLKMETYTPDSIVDYSIWYGSPHAHCTKRYTSMHSFGSGIMWHDYTSPKSYTIRLWDFWVNTCERWVSSLCNMNEYHWKTQWISSFNSIFWHHITYDSRKMLRIWPNGVLFFASALPKLAMLWMGKGWHPLVKQHSWLEHVVAKMKSLVVFQLAGKLLDHRQKGQGCMQHDSIRGTNPTNGSSVSLWHRCSLVPGGPKTEAMYFHIKVTRCSVHTHSDPPVTSYGTKTPTNTHTNEK